MIGTSWRREQGLKDPLLVEVMQKMGLDKVPLYENPSQERTRYGQEVSRMGQLRDGPVNPRPVAVEDRSPMTDRIKDRARELGADLVGVARLRPIHVDLGIELDHESIIAIGVHEDYDKVLEAPRAVEAEAHRAYYMVALIATELGS